MKHKDVFDEVLSMPLVSRLYFDVVRYVDNKEEREEVYDSSVVYPYAETIVRSLVEHNDGHLAHMPLVDFDRDFLSETDFTGDLAQGWLRTLLWRQGIPEMHIFSSGRALHGYGVAVLSRDEWIRFMGSLLLLNAKNQPAIVDARWVGHSLRKGFGGLRLTCSTKRYLKVPTYVKTITALDGGENYEGY